MTIVVDSSAVIAAILVRGEAQARLRGASLHAPHLIDAEVVAVLRRLSSADPTRIAALRVDLNRWAQLALRRHAMSPLLARVWELRANLTAYDSMYVALAEALGAPLITTDRRLGGAPGIRCVVEVLPAA